MAKAAVAARALITPAQLKSFAPHCAADVIAPSLASACRANGIDTNRRLRHFMAHLHHESMGFTRLEESLSYSAKRLMEVWPRRFRSLEAAQPYARNPMGLAEKVYGGRLGNRLPGDGWRYRGSGWIMLTGLDNFARAEKWSGLPLRERPELARQVESASVIAASFWAAEGCNEIVDEDPGETAIVDLAERMRANERDDLIGGTLEVNGGLIGLQDRARQLERAASIWP